MTTRDSERIWFQDPRGFFRDDRLAHFLPTRNTTLAVQLNALLRMAIYLAVILLLFRRYSMAVYVPLGVAVLTYGMYVTNDTGLRDQDAARAARKEGMTREGEVCTVPTHSNPYMNVMLSDYDNPTRPPACDLSAQAVGDRAESLFEDNLYRDVDDVFQRRTSSHSFYTMPNTQIPNDQGGFAEWCYGRGPTCKEGNGSQCFRNLPVAATVDGGGTV
ncbi:MAG: hypothetical protein WDW38_006540 [Sanguina aurantia]